MLQLDLTKRSEELKARKDELSRRIDKGDEQVEVASKSFLTELNSLDNNIKRRL